MNTSLKVLLIIVCIIVVLFMVVYFYLKSKTKDHDPNIFYRLPPDRKFISAQPRLISLSDHDQGPPVRVITVGGGGADYVNAVGHEEIHRMHEQYFKTMRLSGMMPKVKLDSLVDKFYNKPRAEYQTQFYREMAPMLIKRKGEETDEDVVKRLIYVDCMWETYIYVYLTLRDEDHIPPKIIDALSRVGCITTLVKGPWTKGGKTIIFHNFDWMTAGYDGLPLSFIHFKKFGITQIGFVGAPFCIIAAYNDKGVWTNINNATYSLGLRIDWKLPDVSTSVFTLLKDAPDAKTLGDNLMKHNYDIACFYFAGDKNGLLSVVSDGLGTQRYEYHLSDDMFIVANKTVNLEWGNEADPFGFGSDSDNRKRNIGILFNNHRGDIDARLMAHIAQEPLYMNNGEYGTGATEYKTKHRNQDLTMFQTIYVPEDKKFYCRGQFPFSMNSPWFEVTDFGIT